ncbi:MAG: NAD(P)-dependent oxidoreductase, partial [Planctomycetales bacterium]|nr:NAD(P)-dependent oxidoreductase [Planctomycetales bacterium]
PRVTNDRTRHTSFECHLWPDRIFGTGPGYSGQLFMILPALEDLAVGVLYPGEMGSAVGQLLCAEGCDVVTTLDGRSRRTEQLCGQTSLHVLSSFEDVLDVADVIISLVNPNAAVEVARRFVHTAAGMKNPPRLYIDANSTSPASARQIHRLIDARGTSFCDMTICGTSGQLDTHSIAYLSGDGAAATAQLFESALHVRNLGDVVGDASAMKALVSGLTVGVGSLFFEFALLAERMELTDEFLADVQGVHPGVFELLERTLMTYPQYSARHATEMAELSTTFRSLGLVPRTARSAQHTLRQVSSSSLGQRWRQVDSARKNVRTLITLLRQEFPFASDDDTGTAAGIAPL